MTEKRLLQVLNGEKVGRPPVWLMRQAGRYLKDYRDVRATTSSFLEFCYTPEKAAEVTLQPIRKFGFDASILFADILVIPDALGQKVAFKTGEGPVLEAVSSVADLDGLRLDGLHDHLAPVYETLKILKRELPKETTLIGFAGSPWTVATYMVEGSGSKDFPKSKAWAFGDPAGYKILIDRLVDATAEYLIAQVDAGAEVLQLFDSWSGALPEFAFVKYSIEPTAEIVRRVKAVHPDIKIIGFPKGAGPNAIRYAKETGIDAIGLDTSMPLQWAADNLMNLMPVQGNLDPRLLVAGGDLMIQEIDRILETFRDGPHIFNLGHGIVPETPPAHVAQLMDHIRASGD